MRASHVRRFPCSAFNRASVTAGVFLSVATELKVTYACVVSVAGVDEQAAPPDFARRPRDLPSPPPPCPSNSLTHVHLASLLPVARWGGGRPPQAFP